MPQVHTKEILQQLELTLRNSSILTNVVKTWKLGVLPVTPVFPALSILPNSENILKYYSDGLFVKSRKFDIEVYSSGFPAEAVEANNLEILHKVDNALRIYSNHFLSGYWWDIQFNDSITKVQPIGDDKTAKFICASILPITVLTRNSRYLNSTINYNFDQLTISPTLSTTKVLLEKLKQLFLAYRSVSFSTNDLYLDKIKAVEIVENIVSPVHGYVYILADQSNIERSYTSADKNIHRFEIHHISKAIPKEAFLIENLEVTKRLENILHLYPLLGQSDRLAVSFTSMDGSLDPKVYQEKIIDSQIEDIHYTITPDRNFYDAKITINITTRKLSNL